MVGEVGGAIQLGPRDAKATRGRAVMEIGLGRAPDCDERDAATAHEIG